MATSDVRSLLKQKKEEKDRDLECPICLTEYKKPKLLPCLHTFCQDCLKKYCDLEDDNMVPCPLCKSKFCEPQGGVDKLPDNQFMVRLIYQKGHQEKKDDCDPCREIGEDIKADSFCMECRQSLCNRCTKVHSKLSYAKQHKVVNIEEKPTDYELQRLISNYCNKHDSNKLELYCCDCSVLVCALCHASDHNKHDCRVSHDIARQKKELSENDRKNIEKFRILASKGRQRLVNLKQDFLQQVSSTESSLRKSVDTIRKLLDIYEKGMLEELISIKEKKIKELENEKDLEELHYITLDSFLIYSNMVNERGTDCEIIRAADDLHRRAEELIKEQKTDAMDHDEAQLKFIEAMTPVPEEEIKKLVGKIVYRPIDKNMGLDGKDAYLSSSPEVNIINKQVNYKWIRTITAEDLMWIRGITVVDDEIFVVIHNQSQVDVYDSHSLTASRDINIPDMTYPVGLAGCSYNKALYIGENYVLNCIHRVDLTNNSVTCWKMEEKYRLQNLSITKEHNFLVTMADGEENSLVVEYTSEGQLLREIRLCSPRGFFKRVHAWHTVQLSSDRFVLLHSWDTSDCNKISLINTKGQIIKSYDGERGGGEGQLTFPSSIAFDYNSKHVFVSERDSNTVLMLDTDLTYLGQVRTPSDLREASYLYFDSSTDRLIVGENDVCRVLVISSVRISKKRLGGLKGFRVLWNKGGSRL